jgi:uncharacterized oxidoreductase
MTDLLAGALTGGGCSRPPTAGDHFGSSMLSIVIAPHTILEGHGFGPEVSLFLDFVKSSRPRQEGAEVLLPGEPEARARAAREADGIPVDATTWDHIMAAGEGLGLSRADLERGLGQA